jgi:hypothetical protein
VQSGSQRYSVGTTNLLSTVCNFPSLEPFSMELVRLDTLVLASPPADCIAFEVKYGDFSAETESEMALLLWSRASTRQL